MNRPSPEPTLSHPRTPRSKTRSGEGPGIPCAAILDEERRRAARHRGVHVDGRARGVLAGVVQEAQEDLRRDVTPADDLDAARHRHAHVQADSPRADEDRIDGVDEVEGARRGAVAIDE